MSQAVTERERRDLEAAITAGRLSEAAASGRQLCEKYPGDATLWRTLSVIHGQLHAPADAARCAQRALALRPDDAEAHFYLGAAQLELGAAGEASEHAERALRLMPGNAHVVRLAVRAQIARGGHGRAEQLCRTALAADANQYDLRIALAQILHAMGRFQQAADEAREASSGDPANALAWFVLGEALAAQSDLAGAAAAYRQALQLKRDFAAAYNGLGGVLEKSGHTAEAILAYQDALRYQPNEPAVLSNLGNALRTQGRYTEAETAYRAALARAPTNASMLSNLGALLTAQARYAEGEAACREALRVNPDYWEAHSNLVFGMNYNPARTAGEMHAEHLAWARRFAPAAPRALFGNSRDPARRLRVGYYSPDLRRHPVANFFLPVLAAHDPARVEIYCYAEAAREDAITERMRRHAAVWRRTCGMSDAEFARVVEQDGIDLFVDLAGHTRGCRLHVFAARPAPVQVSYLGYCNTTGLSQIDWRISDRVADPEGSQDFYSEKLWYLDPCFFCYAPYEDLPEMSALPALSSGRITFGSLTNPAKLNDAVIDLWSRVLHAVPDSRLLVAHRMHKGEFKARFERAFAERGLGSERVEILGAIPVKESHLRIYDRIDIALDTFPWSGHTTCSEALSMGVPVVTLTGNRHASRMVASLLNAIGRADLIAGTPERFVAIASELAADPDALGNLRAGLRARLLASPACDAAGFTRKLEDAYRAMWGAWCASGMGA